MVPRMFVEEQRLLSRPVAGGVIAAMAIVACFAVASGHPWNLLGIGSVAALVALIAAIRMIVRVSSDTVQVKYDPFVDREIALADVAECDARRDLERQLADLQSGRR